MLNESNNDSRDAEGKRLDAYLGWLRDRANTRRRRAVLWVKAIAALCATLALLLAMPFTFLHGLSVVVFFLLFVLVAFAGDVIAFLAFFKESEHEPPPPSLWP